MLRRILICLALVLVATSAAHADSSTVLVFPFENLSNDRTLDWIGEGIAELIIDRLQPEPAVYVSSREERLTIYEKIGIPETTVVSRATGLKLGWDYGFDHIVMGTFSGTADHFQITGRLVDMEEGGATEFKTEGKLEDVIPSTMTLSLRMLRKIIPGTASPESDLTARPPTPRSAFENYVRGILNQDLKKRIDLLETAVRLYPQYAAALYELGRAYHLQREFRMSNQWLQKVSPSTSNYRHVQFMIGLNYFYLGDHAHAISTFQQLPQTFDVLLNAGTAMSQKGDQAGALAAWKRAADLEPLSNDAFFNMGYVSFVRGDLDGAAKNLDDSLKLRGRDSEALFLLGRTYEKQGRQEEGQRLIAQASRLSQRVERWLTQPLPKLERFVAPTTFRSHDEIWNDQRLARRARYQELTGWFDAIQTEIDSHLFGDALREIHDVMRIFPDSTEARSLLNEVERQRKLR